ncbi:MAG: SPFH domain-containing protein [Ferruginibacter sp.]|nr:SPFH domain-containing protein [Cytophagales bacterium]
MVNETAFKPLSGYLMIGVELLIFLGAGVFQASNGVVMGALLALLAVAVLRGFFVVNPNESQVLVLFGDYQGTVKESGFHWVNPFFTRSMVSLRANNLNGAQLKVNDKLGNPIEIAAVIVWQVQNTTKAIFEVTDYKQFVVIQSEAAVRHLANSYSYDHFDEEETQITLRSGGEKVNEMLEKELNDRLERAGILVTEARISHLAYAPEIAHAMLQRQQATAVVAARRQIVEGAVGMVEMALEKLSEKKIVELDEERKAAMVSNLLVVLCGEKSVSPVVNAGTLHP